MDFSRGGGGIFVSANGKWRMENDQRTGFILNFQLSIINFQLSTFNYQLKK